MDQAHHLTGRILDESKLGPIGFDESSVFRGGKNLKRSPQGAVATHSAKEPLILAPDGHGSPGWERRPSQNFILASARVEQSRS
jgi:hypothetical protein